MSIKDVVNVENAWEIIINRLFNKRQELSTLPKTNKKPIWFSAISDGNIISINKASINEPSSKITAERKLTYTNFKEVYPLFIKRENDEKVSKEVSNKTRNQVYYFSLIGHLVYNYK
ncbi:hypothetical protein [Clostridium tertium]|uniref:Uncharacterized protein n=1 Tax=Clostridium tertium TaxID=1559 RepID=A0A6N2YQQ5_9CLOT